MDNVIGAILGIVLLLISIALFPIGFMFSESIPGPGGDILLAACFVLGILFLSACLPIPVFLLERFEGVRDRRR